MVASPASAPTCPRLPQVDAGHRRGCGRGATRIASPHPNPHRSGGRPCSSPGPSIRIGHRRATAMAATCRSSSVPSPRPTDLGIPAPEVFARVWAFAPPARVTTGVYGAVAYGPLSSIYRLCTIPVAIEPFYYELRAYSRGYQLHRRQEAYSDWRSVTLAARPRNTVGECLGV